MKKLALTIGIVLMMGLGASAQTSLLGKENSYDEGYRDGEDVTTPFILPGSHGGSDDVDATPLGTGIAVLTALGTAYLVGKRRREE